MDFVYTLIMLAAVVTCGVLLKRTQRTLPIPWQDRLAIGIAAFCGAMIGAKLPFVLWSDPTAGDSLGNAWFSNGKTILAGLVGGYFAVEAVKKLLEIRTKTGDTFAAPVAIAIAIGRLGCFRAGCCFGAPTDLPWGVVFPAIDTLPRHPTQLYEATFHFAMACLLVVLQRNGLFQRQLLKLYIITYACYRFLTEMIRPEPEFFAGLTAYQWASLVIVLIFTWLWRQDAKAIPAPPTTPPASLPD